jgi:hypothetical protein
MNKCHKQRLVTDTKEILDGIIKAAFDMGRSDAPVEELTSQLTEQTGAVLKLMRKMSEHQGMSYTRGIMRELSRWRVRKEDVWYKVELR